jgi:hypothetical protein
MLFLGHLVIGLIIGFILYEFFHARSLIAFCALGSVLPDIVDKPLGHIVFGSSLDNGKIFFHSLVIVLLFFLAGLIVWKYYRSFSFLVVGFGIFLHQLVDMMFAPGFFLYQINNMPAWQEADPNPVLRGDPVKTVREPRGCRISLSEEMPD